MRSPFFVFVPGLLLVSGTVLGEVKEGRKEIAGWGNENALGGDTAVCEALHHDGLSAGNNAPVQSKPIHQRWFSYIVNRNRTELTGVSLDVVLDAAVCCVCMDSILGGRGAPVRYDESR